MRSLHMTLFHPENTPPCNIGLAIRQTAQPQ